MQPQLLTIIVIIVILYVIQNTSNRIVKEPIMMVTDPKKWRMHLSRDEEEEVDKLCEKGYNDYFHHRFNHPFYYNHKKALLIGQSKCLIG
jgi:hypothetical protein